MQSELSNLNQNALKKENIDLKKKINSIEKDYIEIFRNLKHIENENTIEQSQKKEKFLLFDENVEDFFKQFNNQDFNYLQFKESFKLAKSYVKDIITFFISKQDFFNSNLYDGSSLKTIENADRCKENNIKACFMK